MSSQNVTLPSLGNQILDLLASKQLSAQAALNAALESDEWREYRQVTAVDSQGRTAFFSGKEALGLYNAVAGQQCVAAGNLLSDQSVIAAMVPAFENTSGELADRLLAAMQAAMDAGGEAGPVHSAALKIVGDVPWPIADLRVDWADEDPIGQLQGLWKAYQPQMQDYLSRALNPTVAPSYGVPGDE